MQANQLPKREPTNSGKKQTRQANHSLYIHFFFEYEPHREVEETQRLVNEPRANEALFFNDLGVRIGREIMTARHTLWENISLVQVEEENTWTQC